MLIYLLAEIGLFDMNNIDKIEFYDAVDGGLVAVVPSSMVPPVQSFINIRGKTYQISSVTYALDDADHASERRMRANVNVIAS